MINSLVHWQLLSLFENIVRYCPWEIPQQIVDSFRRICHWGFKLNERWGGIPLGPRFSWGPGWPGFFQLVGFWNSYIFSFCSILLAFIPCLLFPQVQIFSQWLCPSIFHEGKLGNRQEQTIHPEMKWPRARIQDLSSFTNINLCLIDTLAKTKIWDVLSLMLKI